MTRHNNKAPYPTLYLQILRNFIVDLLFDIVQGIRENVVEGCMLTLVHTELPQTIRVSESQVGQCLLFHTPHYREQT